MDIFIFFGIFGKFCVFLSEILGVQVCTSEKIETISPLYKELLKETFFLPFTVKLENGRN